MKSKVTKKDLKKLERKILKEDRIEDDKTYVKKKSKPKKRMTKK
jgi:hypothetical protein